MIDDNDNEMMKNKMYPIGSTQLLCFQKYLVTAYVYVKKNTN